MTAVVFDDFVDALRVVLAMTVDFAVIVLSRLEPRVVVEPAMVVGPDVGVLDVALLVNEVVLSVDETSLKAALVALKLKLLVK